MRRSTFWLTAFLTALVLTNTASAQTRLPAEAYGRLPVVDDVVISPDGLHAAFVVNQADGRQGFRVTTLPDGASVISSVMQLAGRESEQTLLRSVHWADNEHLAFQASAAFSVDRALPQGAWAPGSTRLERWSAGLVDIASGRQYYVYNTGNNAWGVSLSNLMSPIENDPGYGRVVAMNSVYSGERRLTVYRVNLATGLAQPMEGGDGTTRRYLLNARGEPAYRVDVNPGSNAWTIRTLNDGSSRILLQGVSELGRSPGVVGVLADNRLAIVEELEEGRGRSVLYALGTGAQKTVLLEHPRYDITSAVVDPWTHLVVGAVFAEEMRQQLFLEADLTEALARLRALDQSASAYLLNWSRDRSRFIVYFERASDAGGYYMFEPATSRLTLIAMRFPDLTGEHLGRRQAITYPARDGTRIPAYLTLPATGEARNLPAIVLVHGGPAMRETFEYSWWASFLASRGYAVIEPNFRGSSGFGQEWERAGHGGWGRLMQSDLDDAMDALVRSRIIDPARACIMGWDYGGYAALAGVTLTPDRYRCAVSVAGVSDLPLLLTNSATRYGTTSEYVDRLRLELTGPRSDQELEAVSPAHLAARAKAAVLLIHGANDTAVPVQQSRRMEQRMRAAGGNVRLVEYPAEDHQLADAPTRIQTLREIETFLAQHLPVSPAP